MDQGPRGSEGAHAGLTLTDFGQKETGPGLAGLNFDQSTDASDRGPQPSVITGKCPDVGEFCWCGGG